MAETKNGKIWRIFAIAMTAVIALVAVVYGYGQLNHRVETVEKLEPKVQLQGEAIIRIETDIGYIKKSQTKSETAQGRIEASQVRIEAKLDNR